MKNLTRKERDKAYALHRLTDGREGIHRRRGEAFIPYRQNVKIYCDICFETLELRLILHGEVDGQTYRSVYVLDYVNNIHRNVTVFEDGRVDKEIWLGE